MYKQMRRSGYRLLMLAITLGIASCTNLLPPPSQCEQCEELRREYTRMKYQQRTQKSSSASPAEIAQLKKRIARAEFKIREVDAKLRRSGQGYSKYVDDEGNPVEIKATVDGYLERTIYYKDGTTSRARIPRLSPRELFLEKQKYRNSLLASQARLSAISQQGDQTQARAVALSELAGRVIACQEQYCPVNKAGGVRSSTDLQPAVEQRRPVQKTKEKGTPSGDNDLRASAAGGIFASATTDRPNVEIEELDIAPGKGTIKPPKMSAAEAPSIEKQPEPTMQQPKSAEPEYKPVELASTGQSSVPALEKTAVAQAEAKPKTPPNEDQGFVSWADSQGVFTGDGSCSAQFTRLVSDGERDITLSPLGDDVFKGQNGAVTFNIDPSDKQFALHYAADLVFNAKKGWRCMLYGKGAEQFQMECDRDATAEDKPLRCEQVFTRTDNF